MKQFQLGQIEKARKSLENAEARFNPNREVIKNGYFISKLTVLGVVSICKKN